MIGSPYYMSPEQMESARDVDARTDVWALGVTLYELLSGKLPFEGRSLLQVYSRIASDEPLRLRESSPHVPPDLEAVILKCLERQRDRRCPSVAELAAALVRFGSSRARVSVERIGPPAGTREAAPPESLPNETPPGGVRSIPAADATLPSQVRPTRPREGTSSEVAGDKTKRNAWLAAVAGGLLAAALGVGMLLLHVPGRGQAGSPSPTGASAGAVPPAEHASDTPNRGGRNQASAR